MSAKDVTKFEGMMGTGIIVIFAGLLGITAESKLTLVATTHP
jgi:hypothetical protein